MKRLAVILFVLNSICAIGQEYDHAYLDSVVRTRLVGKVDTSGYFFEDYDDAGMQPIGMHYRSLDSIVKSQINKPHIQYYSTVPAEAYHLQLDSIARAKVKYPPYFQFKSAWKSYDWRARLLPASMHFLGGASNGLRQTLLFHYDKFQQRHPGADPQWWDPAISWENKYKRDATGELAKPYQERFFMAKTMLAWTTDGYHATGTLQYAFITAGIVIDLNKRQHWMHYLFDAAVYTVARNAGFHSTYSILYK